MMIEGRNTKWAAEMVVDNSHSKEDQEATRQTCFQHSLFLFMRAPGISQSKGPLVHVDLNI